MRIINRKEFLQMPKGTIYSKYIPCIFDGLYVKTSDPEDYINDWVHVPLVNGFIKNSENNEANHEFFEFDLDGTVRDGLYEEKQIYSIYDKNDILKLIARLTYSFLEADIEQ